MGEAPLLYYRNEHVLHFSSHYKDLLDSGAPNTLNPDLLADYLFINANNHQDTVYQYIHRVPPGAYLVIDKTGQQLVSYFSLEAINAELCCDSYDAYTLKFRQAIEAAVCRRIKGRKIAAHLSSGWDSSAVVSVAAQHMQQNDLKTYTWRPAEQAKKLNPNEKHRFNDESSLAKDFIANADHISNFVALTSNHSCLLDSDEFFEQHRHPNLFGFNHAWYDAILQMAQTHGADTLLTGFSGNFTLSHSGYFSLSQTVRLLGWMKALKLIGSGIKNEPKYYLRELKNFTKSRYFSCRWRFSDKLGKSEQHWFYSFANFDSPVVQQAYQRAVDQGAIDFFNGGHLNVEKVLPSMIRGYSWFAEYNYAQQRRYGVETCSPTLDHDLAVTSLQIPGHILAYKGQARALARSALKTLLPENVLNQKRRGYQNSDWPERFQKSVNDIQNEIDLWHESPLIDALINVGKLQNKLNQWDLNNLPEGKEIAFYTHAIPITVSIGKFIRLTENQNQL
ncbi:Uncharacterised protein [BD1-7 clade bacterium]|uniref:asparagine synthase (glutamine-hydrolyzing) n=1 Tax=BD1-7 clade bacterium TaxID=2029982 RepID=A0A5S9PJE3_9GAMM|nr:Uncharacterised protein [BD1-7 clade bacterium]